MRTTVRHYRYASIGAGLTLLAVVAQAAGLATDGPRLAPRADIRVDTNLVLIPVSVTDSSNRPVVGLDARQFRVFEGRTEQQVLHLSANDAPVSVGIVFDCSASMAEKLPKAREAVAAFLQGANPEDEFFLVTFNQAVELAAPFTNNAADIQNRLMFATTSGKTALLDAVHKALATMREAHNPRKALLIISDGGDNDSRYTEWEIRRSVQESGVSIYALGIYGAGQAILPEEEREGPKLLADLAEQTGGRHFAVRHAGELPAAAARIGLELRNQYLLGYRPRNVEANGRYRKVQVKLVDPANMLLSWRPGYYAPLP